MGAENGTPSMQPPPPSLLAWILDRVAQVHIAKGLYSLICNQELQFRAASLFIMLGTRGTGRMETPCYMPTPPPSFLGWVLEGPGWVCMAEDCIPTMPPVPRATKSDVAAAGGMQPLCHADPTHPPQDLSQQAGEAGSV